MEAVRQELVRIGRGMARRGGQVRAARWHLLLLVVAVVAAFLSRAWRPLPGLEHIQGAVLPVLITAAALYAFGFVLAWIWTRFLRPSPRYLARSFDERYGWYDETTTALSLQSPEGDAPLAQLLVAQTEGRLKEIEPRGVAPTTSAWVLPRRLLAFLFAFLLLAPGVDGLLGELGAGTQGDDALGGEGAEEAFSAPRPMRADFWLQAFIENPLPVEPLPPEPAADGDQAGDATPGDEKAGDDKPADDSGDDR